MDKKIYAALCDKLSNRDYESFAILLTKYEESYPKDFDVLLLKIAYYIENNMLENAFEVAQMALEQNRLNFLANFDMAVINELSGDWIESIRYYCRLFVLQMIRKDEAEDIMDIKSLSQKIILLSSKISEEEFRSRADKYMKFVYEMLQNGKASIDITKNMYTDFSQLTEFFGIHELDDSKYYFARYEDWLHSSRGVRGANNGVESKVEIREIEAIANQYSYRGTTECILPCVMNPNLGEMAQIQIDGADGRCNYIDYQDQSYSYHRIQPGTEFHVNHPVVIGKPVPLYQDVKNKKLVLTIFVDSFNAKILDKYPLEKLMPNTYKFFKKGIMCTNAYAGSEFTYPSITSYWTGMRPTHHKNLNDQVSFPIEQKFHLLSEYFHDAGYFTAKIGGNYSVIPDYGYLRGIDRFVYQQWIQGFNVHQVVDELIEHMETYQETNQFIWCDIPDLHDVAGRWPRSMSVQSNVSYVTNEIDNFGGSSLHQTFSPRRQEVYVSEMQHIDTYLEMLYHYIETHYNKEDVVVAFLSDHGNGFNVRTEEPFLSEERMKVPLMFYCDFEKKGICDEIIESIDYIDILCKLCGIEKASYRTDGNLPVFFGGKKEREFALAQSIFQGAPYYAGIFCKNHNFYLQTKYPTTWDCRIDFSEVMYKLTDKNGNEIADETEGLSEKYWMLIKKEIEEFDLNYGRHIEN